MLFESLYELVKNEIHKSVFVDIKYSTDALSFYES